MRGRDAAIVIGAVVLVILLVSSLGGGMMSGWGMMRPGMGSGAFGFNPMGWIVMLVFWVLIVGGVALLAFRLFRGVTPAAAAPRSPVGSLEILKERFARGEITREQYEETRRVLEGR
jgi:putative membrane protein